jgi:hypothetical protein
MKGGSNSVQGEDNMSFKQPSTLRIPMSGCGSSVEQDKNFVIDQQPLEKTAENYMNGILSKFWIVENE